MINRYTVTIDGRTRAVEIEDVEGKLRVVVDGRERELDVRSLEGGGVWSCLEGEGARLIEVDGVGKKLTIEVSHPDGEPRICTAEVSDARATAAKPGAHTVTASTGPLTLRAPIPGKVVKVLVKRGDGVEAGQALLVLEAMKMENELRAPRAGVVSLLHVPEGAAVDTGQDLISLG
jgi:biotin carboxyl carrier protein